MSADGSDRRLNTPALGLNPASTDALLERAFDVIVWLQNRSKVKAVRVNPAFTAAHEGLSHWVGGDIREVLTEESIEKFEARILGAETREAQTIQLNHLDGPDGELPVEYVMTPPDAEDVTLMLGRSLHMIAEAQQNLARTQIVLERERERQRQHEIKYGLLMRRMRDACLLINADSGQIVDASDAFLRQIGASREAIVGRPLGVVFETPEDDGDGPLGALQSCAAREAPQPLRLAWRGGDAAVSVTPEAFRAVADRLLLCRVADQTPSASGPDALSSSLTAFYAASVDAIVVADDVGGVVSANEAFLRLAGAADAASIAGRGMGEFFARGSIDLKTILTTVAENQRIQGYQTSIRNAFGAETKVDVAAVAITPDGAPRIAFLIRDSRGKATPVQNVDYLSDQAARNIVELIGGVDLKDIVSDTTDVIEKMCIEVALEMTNNNRVAAANMLGLSRQSLYVKIRKYGI